MLFWIYVALLLPVMMINKIQNSKHFLDSFSSNNRKYFIGLKLARSKKEAHYANIVMSIAQMKWFIRFQDQKTSKYKLS